MRTLEKYTKKIIEKIAYQLVRDSSIQKIEIDETLLIKYIGQPKYMHSRFYKETPIVIKYFKTINSFTSTISL